MTRNINRGPSAGLRQTVGTAAAVRGRGSLVGPAQRAVALDEHPTTAGDATTTDATPAKNDTGMPVTPTGADPANAIPDDGKADDEVDRGAGMEWLDELGS
ncbi:MAG: hypothetical protein ACREQ5_04365 [Candidatus Dormibacteria bacterium]